MVQVVAEGAWVNFLLVFENDRLNVALAGIDTKAKRLLHLILYLLVIVK